MPQHLDKMGKIIKEFVVEEISTSFIYYDLTYEILVDRKERDWFQVSNSLIYTCNQTTQPMNQQAPILLYEHL